MTAGIQIASAKSRLEIGWAVLCLLLGLLALGFLAGPASADVDMASVRVVSLSADDQSGCDDGYLGVAGHCHTTTTCFAYAQADTASISPDLQISGHPEAVSQRDLASRVLQPNLRPPKHPVSTPA